MTGRRASLVGAATLCAAAMTVGIAPTHARPIVYDLAPFHETAPELTVAHAAASAEPPDRLGLLAALAALEGFEPRDAVEDDTASWLRARVLTALGADDRAETELQRLAADPGAAFHDAAVDRLARALEDDDPAVAAALWLGRHPGAPGFDEGITAAIASMAPRAAADALSEVVGRSLQPRDRPTLLSALVRLYVEAGDEAAAVSTLRALWWRAARRGGEPEAVASRLAALDAPVPFWQDAMRTLLIDRRAPSARDMRRAFSRRHVRGGQAKRIHRFVKILVSVASDDLSPERALERIDRHYAERLGADEAFAPYLHFARAELLRALDRRPESAEIWRDLAHANPEMPLSWHALERASLTLRVLERAPEARDLDRVLATRTPHGPLQRDALWRAGFDAFLAGDVDEAERHLVALERAYGGERAGTGLRWLVRARYWRARNLARIAHHLTAASGGSAGAVAAAHPAPDGCVAWSKSLTSPVSSRLRPTPVRATTTSPAPPCARSSSGERSGLERRPAEADRHFASVILRFPGTWYARLAHARLGARAPSAPPDGRLVGPPELATAVAWLRLGDTDRAYEAAYGYLRAGAIPGAGQGLFGLLDPEHAHEDEIDAVAGRFEEVREHLTAAAEEFEVDPALLAAIAMVETRFDPRAKSSAGALGLCQLMPATGRALWRSLYGGRFRLRRLLDPRINLRLAAYMLTRLRERVGDHPAVILTAYNAGGGRALRWLDERLHDETDIWVEQIPASQARHYVQSVLTVAEEVRDRYALAAWPNAIPPKVH